MTTDDVPMARIVTFRLDILAVCAYFVLILSGHHLKSRGKGTLSATCATSTSSEGLPDFAIDKERVSSQLQGYMW
jgi:hypothetical protein